MHEFEKYPKDAQANGEHSTGLPPRPAPSYEGETDFQTPARPASTPRIVTDSESLAQEIGAGLLDAYIGHGIELSGEMGFKGMLRVDGHLSGRINSPGGTLILSTGGCIDADIEVAVALINGTINGNVTASERIEISRVARVTGNIRTPALRVEEGAVIEGSCRMAGGKEVKDGQGEEQEATDTLVMRAGGTGSY